MEHLQLVKPAHLPMPTQRAVCPQQRQALMVSVDKAVAVKPGTQEETQNMVAELEAEG